MAIKPTVALRAILVGGIAAFAKIGGALKAVGGVKVGVAAAAMTAAAMTAAAMTAAAMTAAASAAMSGSKQESKDAKKQPTH